MIVTKGKGNISLITQGYISTFFHYHSKYGIIKLEYKLRTANIEFRLLNTVTKEYTVKSAPEVKCDKMKTWMHIRYKKVKIYD
jgi:hypothetical protein